MYPNPFIYKKPLHPVQDEAVMIGRPALLEKTISGLALGHWYVVSGGKKIGKTTFLAMLTEECRRRGLPYHFVLIKPEDLDGFNVAGLYHALSERWQDLPGAGRAALCNELPASPDLEGLKRALAAASQHVGATSRIVVLLDSFETFSKTFTQDLLRVLINLQQSQATQKLPPNFQFIISGTLDTLDLQVEKGHSFSEYSMRILLEDFRYEDVEDMLSRACRRFELSCEAGFGRLVYEATAGTGYLLQKICYRTLESAYVRKETMGLTLKRAEAAIASILKEGETNVEMVITQIERDSQLVESLMRVLRAGSVSSKKFDPPLKTLLALGALTEQNGFFRPRNRIYESIFQDYFTTERLADIYFSQQKYQRARELFTVAVNQQAVAKNILSTLRSNLEMIDTKAGQGNVIRVLLEAFMNAVDNTRNCSFMTVEPAHERLHIVDALGLGAEDLQTFALKVGQGVAGWVAQVGRPRFVRDITDEIECPDFAYRDMAVKYKVNALACLPLKVAGKVWGVISLGLGKPREFSESEVKMLEIMACHASLVLQQARLEIEWDRHFKLVEQVRALVHNANQQIELEAFFEEILLTVEKVAGTASAYLVYREHTPEDWRFKFRRDFSVAGRRLPSLEQGEGTVGAVLKGGQPLFIENTSGNDPAFAIWPEQHWELALPCLGDDRLQGCLVVAGQKPAVPTFPQRQLLGLLAEAAATALRNRWLYHIAEKKTQQVITARGISEALSHENSLQEILNFIASECLNVVGRTNKMAFVWIKDAERQRLLLQAVDGEQANRELVGKALPLGEDSLPVQVFRSGQPHLAKELAGRDLHAFAHPQVNSEIAVPLIFREETIGVLDVQSTEPHDFDEQDQDTLTAVAHNAAVAMKIGEWHDLRIKAQIGLAKVLEATAIEEAVAGLTHDIKNISTLIASETQWLERREREQQLQPAEIKRAIQNINAHMQRIEDYANYLRGRAYKAPPEPQWCNLRNVVGEAVQVIAAKALRQGVEIKRDEVALDLRMYVDPGRLVRAFINIMANALDAMPKGGLLRVNALRSAREIQISFTDNGSGIPEDMVYKVLNPFISTKPKGYGLGLAVTKRIVEVDHGGKLRLRSKEKQGTTVEVVLPLHLENHQPGPQTNGPPPISKWASTAAGPEEAPAAGGSILVVNDDALMLARIAQELSRLGYRVTSTEFGNDAVELTQRRRFDAILLDYHLRKDRSATQTAQDFIPLLKRYAPAAKIIITSASWDQSSFPELGGEVFLEINHLFWNRMPGVVQRCLLASRDSIRH